MEEIIKNEIIVCNKEENLKFRVFNLKTKTFYKEKLFISSDGKNVIDKNGKKLNLKENIIQRCTGKKDIKGNLIFHGDLLITDEGAWRAFVVWSGGGFYLTDKRGGFSSIPNWENCEIIGNMFTFDEKNEIISEELKTAVRFWNICWDGDEKRLIKLIPSCKNFINKNIKYQGIYLSLPLIAAICSKNIKCVKILLKNGAEIDRKCKDMKSTSLEWAKKTLKEDDEILSLILKKSAKNGR